MELQTQIPIIHVWHQDKGFRVAAIRNRAIEMAKGDYIIQIDGDVILHKYFIADHLELAERGYFVCGSRVWLREETTDHILKGDIMQPSCFKEDLRFALNGLRSKMLRNYLAKRYGQNKISRLRGCNMAFWRDDLLKVNGYNEDLTMWGQEDTEMAYRLIHSGVKKKFLKMGGVQYHLYHTKASRERLMYHNMVLRKVIIQRTAWCANGINKGMNLAKSIEACAAHGAQLVVLQELHNSLYFCQTENTQLFDLAEPIPGPSTGFYSELAAANDIVLVTSLFEKRAPGLYHNTAVVFERDGSIAGKYRKMHIPDDPAYYEKFYFTPGDIGFEPIQTSLGKLGVLVCWDQWYPEAARLMALKGAEILIYPTAIGWESSDTDDEKARQLNAWIISQRGHAVANGLPVVSVNRVGHEPDPSMQTNGILFWGNSFVAGPQGEFLAQAGNERPENIVVEVDLERSENVRRWWPFLRDRRIDAYAGLTKRFLD